MFALKVIRLIYSKKLLNNFIYLTNDIGVETFINIICKEIKLTNIQVNMNLSRPSLLRNYLGGKKCYNMLYHI